MLSDTASGTFLAASSVTVSRQNIIFFDHTSKISGGEIALFNLVTALNPDRYKPVVVVCTRGPLVDLLQEANIETHVLALDESVLETRKDSLGFNSLLQFKKAFSTLGYVFKLAALFRRLNANLIHANSLKSDIIGACSARIAGVPVIWHVRDRIAEDYLPSKVVKLFRELCKYLPTHVITISQATRETLPDAHEPRGKFNQKVTIVHDGVAPDAIQTSKRNWQENQPVRVGIIGRLSPWKGQHIFLKAAASVLKEFPETVFQIVGSPLFGEKDYESELHQLTKTLALEKSVQFLGFQENVLEVIAELDIVVHASTIAEPFGQVIVEGMAAQKPVIATKGGGALEIIEDGRSGLLVEMNDENAMAKALLELLRNPDKARQIGLNAQKRVQDHFMIANTARNVEKVYEKVLQG